MYYCRSCQLSQEYAEWTNFRSDDNLKPCGRGEQNKVQARDRDFRINAARIACFT